jgi:uncharacterized iron-regulated protein
MPRRFLLLIGLCLAACKSAKEEKQEPEDTSAVEREVALPRADQLPEARILRTARETGFEDVRTDLIEADVVYVNLAPRLEGGGLLPLTILDQLFGYGRLHALGLDIFDRTHREPLREFSFGRINLGELLARTGVDPGPYRPLLEFAVRRRLPVIALDLEPRIVATLKESGFKGLSEEERRDLSPVNLRNPAFTDAVRRHLKRIREGAPDEREFQRELLAADLRFETMADALVRWYRSSPSDAQVVVVADLFSIANRHALPDRVRRRTGKDDVVIVQIAGSDAVDRTHNRAFADYVWLLEGKGE